MNSDIPIPEDTNNKGYWDLLRTLVPGDSVWLPISTGTAGGHANAVFGKGNYATRKELKGARIWRKA